MEKQKKVTIYDLADELGVSVGTIYRALHNTGRINAETKERILQKAKEMNYTANVAAQSLRRTPINIGVIFIGPIVKHNEELKMGMQKAFDDLAELNVYSDIRVLPETISDDNISAIEELLKDFKNKQYKAVILSPAGDIELLVPIINRLSQEGMLFATVAVDIPEANCAVAVSPNGHCVGKLAAELLSFCCPNKNVTILTEKQTMPMHAEYISGFMEFAQNDKFENIEIYENEGNVNRFINSINRTIEKADDGDGIYITSAISLYTGQLNHALLEHKNIKIIATDLFEETRNLINSGLICATIYQNPYEEGYQVVQNLHDHLCQQSEKTSVRITPQIVVKSNMDLYPEKHILR